MTTWIEYIPMQAISGKGYDETDVYDKVEIIYGGISANTVWTLLSNSN